jgi:hypothetical protein
VPVERGHVDSANRSGSPGRRGSSWAGTPLPRKDGRP